MTQNAAMNCSLAAQLRTPTIKRGGDSGTAFRQECPAGTWVRSWVGTTTATGLQSLTITCSNNVALNRTGGTGGTSFAAATYTTGFRSVRVTTGAAVNSIQFTNVDGGSTAVRGVNTGTAAVISCASDARVAGFHGTVLNNALESFGLVCEKRKCTGVSLA